MADMFLGGSFGCAAFGCQCFVVGGRKSGLTRCVFDVGGESYIFVRSNLVNAISQINLSSFSFVSFPALYLNHLSSSKPAHHYLLLVAELLLLLLLLSLSFYSNVLLAKPPMSDKNSCWSLNVTSNSLHMLLSRLPTFVHQVACLKGDGQCCSPENIGQQSNGIWSDH